MEIVEFSNYFHISTGFGRFKDLEKESVQSLQDDDKNPIAVWNWNKKCYVVPIAAKPKVYEIGKKHRAKHILIKDQLPENFDVIPALPKLKINIPLKMGKMRDYQEEGVARGLELKRFINGDQAGLGKTLQSVATVIGAEQRGEISFPVLVICPSSLKENWKREFEQWSDKKAMILTDKTKTNWHRFIEMNMADVIIVNFESVKKFFVASMPLKKNLKHSSQIIMDPRIKLFKSVIIDESHRLKSKTSMVAMMCVRITVGKEYIILLTGTPVVNKPIDLFTQLAMMFKLDRFGGKTGFIGRYCEGGSGAANLKELNYLMNMSCYFMRKKKDVLKDLPQLVRQNLMCEITNMKEFKKVKDEFADFLATSTLTESEVKRKLGSEVIVKITMLLQLSAIGKMEAAKEYIDEILESDEKIVIFIKHKIIVQMLLEIYPDAVCVTGNENAQQKQKSVDSFQQDPKVKIIICNYKSAGVGLTLTAASEMLMIEFPYTQADCEQAEARCHRLGQPNSVRATYLIGDDTLDQWLYNLIQDKKEIADQITGSEDEIPVSMVSKAFDLFKNK